LTGCGEPEAKPEPKKTAEPAPPATQPEPKPATQPEAKPETKPEPPAAPMAEPKPEAKPQAAAKAEAKPEPKPEAKPQAAPKPEPAAKAEPKPATQVAMNSAAAPAGGAAGMPPAPKVSTFAPAADLARQLTKFLKELEKTTATEADYKEDEEKVGRDANTVILIALALGLHDEDNKYQASAGALITAAQQVTAAKDYAACKQAVAALKAAAKNKEKADLKWVKVASLPLVMKEVPLINTKLKRAVDKKRKDAPDYAAVLAVIAQGSMANVSETKKPGEAAKWFDFCTKMRTEAAAVNTSLHAGDGKATSVAMESLQKNCEDCHAVFHPKEDKK
jgi:hypothetical protein